MLDTTYRPYAPMTKHTSVRFYQGQLKADPCNDNRSFFLKASRLLPRLSVTDSLGKVCNLVSWAHFIDVTNGKHYSRETGSLHNPTEALVAVELAAGLVKLSLEVNDMVILTPYVDQVTFIKTLLRRFPQVHGITVETQDLSQGSEKEIITQSLVRTEKQSGHLANEKRCNVATSRAREFVFYIGNWSFFKSFKPWSDVLKMDKDQIGEGLVRSVRAPIKTTVLPAPAPVPIEVPVSFEVASSDALSAIGPLGLLPRIAFLYYLLLVFLRITSKNQGCHHLYVRKYLLVENGNLIVSALLMRWPATLARFLPPETTNVDQYRFHPPNPNEEPPQATNEAVSVCGSIRNSESLEDQFPRSFSSRNELQDDDFTTECRHSGGSLDLGEHSENNQHQGNDDDHDSLMSFIRLNTRSPSSPPSRGNQDNHSNVDQAALTIPPHSLRPHSALARYLSLSPSSPSNSPSVAEDDDSPIFLYAIGDEEDHAMVIPSTPGDDEDNPFVCSEGISSTESEEDSRDSHESEVPNNGPEPEDDPWLRTPSSSSDSEDPYHNDASPTLRNFKLLGQPELSLRESSDSDDSAESPRGPRQDKSQGVLNETSPPLETQVRVREHSPSERPAKRQRLVGVFVPQRNLDLD